MSSVDIVMTRGVCFIYYVLQMLSEPCLSLSFAFIWKAKCLLLLLPPPCHDQDHLHIAWGLDELPPPSSFLCAFTSVNHFPPDKSFFTLFLFCHFPCLFLYDLFQLEMVCIVWEVCVFAHLPSYWMLLVDCSRLLIVLYWLSTVSNYCTGINIQHRVTTFFLTVQTQIIAHM